MDISSMGGGSCSVVMTRDLSLARQAYLENDPVKSRLAHQARTGPSSANCVILTDARAKEEHISTGEYVRSIVFGGMDGIITTFAIVAGSHGATLSSTAILALGIANVVADGISMGLGDFVSLQAEKEYARNEWKREKFEFENYPEGEKIEMIELFESKGMSREDAAEVIERLAKYPKLFVDFMVVNELGLNIPDENEQPWKNGLVMFFSFVAFGMVPLISYIVLHAINIDASFDIPFVVACILTCISLFALGVVKSKFVSARWWASGLWVLGIGVLAAGSAYFIGWGMSAALGVKGDC